MAFVFLILVFSIENCGGYLISIANCPFFIIVKCHHNLRKYSILETVRFFLRSVYLSIRLHFEQNNQIKITDKVMYISSDGRHSGAKIAPETLWGIF